LRLQSAAPFPDNAPITTDGVYALLNDKIEGSLAEGRALLAADRPKDAALVFERVLLLSPDDPAARAGLSAANAAVAERERVLEERLADAERHIEEGDHGDARALIDAVVREGGDAGRAAALLERIPILPRWYAPRPADSGSYLAPPAGSAAGRSRLVLGSACAILFLALGSAVASNWDGLLRRLAQAPVPRDSSVSVSTLAAARPEDQTIAAARKLLEQGDAARAVALLDSVSPQQPSYPFARQLRGQAERALRQTGGRP
jgi:hypothetical protein